MSQASAQSGKTNKGRAADLIGSKRWTRLVPGAANANATAATRAFFRLPDAA